MPFGGQAPRAVCYMADEDFQGFQAGLAIFGQPGWQKKLQMVKTMKIASKDIEH